MYKWAIGLSVLILSASLACNNSDTPIPANTGESIVTVVPVATPTTTTFTPSHTVTPMLTPNRTSRPVPTQPPTATVTQTPTFTPTPAPRLTPTPTSTPVPTDTPTPTPVPTGASRDNPVPLGKSGTTHDDFQVWVVEVQKDAHEKVVEANIDESFYENPPTGYVHIIVRIRVKSLSVAPQSLSKWDRLRPSQLEFQQCHTPAGGGYYSYNVPDEYDDDRLMFQGGEIEGNLCFTVKESDLDSLVMFDQGRGGSSWLFFALQ